MKKLLVIAVLAAVALAAGAERADSLKQAEIKYDSLDVDNVTLDRILTGDVVITRGTLMLKSDKAVLKESPDGYIHVTLTGGDKKVATFRQKRDGGADLWIEGQSEKIEYDEKGELVKLIGAARVKELDGAKVMSQIESAFISYDSRKEIMVARNDASGANKPGKGRGTLIIAPRQSAPAPVPAQGKQ
jgi:lipopolysaccharide export system protein LptA